MNKFSDSFLHVTLIGGALLFMVITFLTLNGYDAIPNWIMNVICLGIGLAVGFSIYELQRRKKKRED